MERWPGMRWKDRPISVESAEARVSVWVSLNFVVNVLN